MVFIYCFYFLEIKFEDKKFRFLNDVFMQIFYWYVKVKNMKIYMLKEVDLVIGMEKK